MSAGLCRIIAALAMVCVSFTAVAQVIPPSAQPGRERERFRQPIVPLPEVGGAGLINLPGSEAPPGAAKVKLVLRGIKVVGSTVYTAAQLAEIYGDLVGKKITVKDVYDIAQRITARYGKDGYILSRAIVPPQQLNPSGSVVRIQVIEGYVDKVVWPAALAPYRNFFTYYEAQITADRPANIRTIERYLLLAGDLPGLKFKNSLKPHPSKPGAAILVVEVTEKPVDLLARFDNRGTKARGPLEFLTSTTINNLMRMHEAFTFTFAGATELKELQYYGGTYRQVLTPEGLTGFFNASYGFGRPGTAVLEILHYQTKSLLIESGLSYPVIRSRERNLIVTGLAFASDDRSIILDLPETPPSTHDRLRGVRFRADADLADQFAGINQANFVLSHGFDGFGSTGNSNPLASRVNGRVDFTKVELTLTRLQALGRGFSLLLSAYGQYAATPLLVSELCSFGGRVFGRGFDPSQYVGDSCLEAFAEMRYDLPFTAKTLTQAQLYGFADHGSLHNLSPVPGTPTNINVDSIGAGVRLGWFNTVSADLSFTRAVKTQALSTAQAVQQGQAAGLPPDNRFFFIIGAKL